MYSKQLIKQLKKIVGIILVIFGIIGLFLPLLQGLLLIFAGLLLLGIRKEQIKEWFKELKRKAYK